MRSSMYPRLTIECCDDAFMERRSCCFQHGRGEAVDRNESLCAVANLVVKSDGGRRG